MMVRQATLDDFDQMVALINATTKKKIEKNIFQWAHPCDSGLLENEIENGEVYLLIHDNRLVGSYSIKPTDQKYPIQIEESYHMYRLIVHPFYKRKDITQQIFGYVRKNYRKKNHVLLDCWAGNETLCEFYKQHDCTFLGDYPEKDYKISIFQVSK